MARSTWWSSVRNANLCGSNKMICPNCEGEGWVCENHSNVPWNEGYPPCCGGAGAPCECNKVRPPWLFIRKTETVEEEEKPKTTLADGTPVTPDHRDLKPNGQQKNYVVLSDEERAKGWVRPYRDAYKHNTCGATTTMSRPIAETYARNPKFYSGTFCVGCGRHFPLNQFVWLGTDQQVGS